LKCARSRHEGHRFARIAGFGQQSLGKVKPARTLEDFAAFLVVKRSARREIARDRLPLAVVVANEGTHGVFLADSHQDGTARSHVIEGREQVVHDDEAD
jgi:hypothetical protein